jgi:hypothetical protein
MDRDLISQSQIFLEHSIRPKINHGPRHMALANPSGPPVLIQVCIESLSMLISNLVVSPHMQNKNKLINKGKWTVFNMPQIDKLSMQRKCHDNI